MINPIASLTPADLRRWLAGKAPAAIVGIAGDCTACVVAQWLSETLCATVAVIHTACWVTVDRQTARYRVPAWVTDYIWGIDALPTETGEQIITAAAAMEILARAERMMGIDEPINVKDFGAVGDGITDDTLAIQAAVNAVGDRS